MYEVFILNAATKDKVIGLAGQGRSHVLRKLMGPGNKMGNSHQKMKLVGRHLNPALPTN